MHALPLSDSWQCWRYKITATNASGSAETSLSFQVRWLGELVEALTLHLPVWRLHIQTRSQAGDRAALNQGRCKIAGRVIVLSNIAMTHQ